MAGLNWDKLNQQNVNDHTVDKDNMTDVNRIRHNASVDHKETVQVRISNYKYLKYLRHETGTPMIRMFSKLLRIGKRQLYKNPDLWNKYKDHKTYSNSEKTRSVLIWSDDHKMVKDVAWKFHQESQTTAVFKLMAIAHNYK